MEKVKAKLKAQQANCPDQAPKVNYDWRAVSFTNAELEHLGWIQMRSMPKKGASSARMVDLDVDTGCLQEAHSFRVLNVLGEGEVEELGKQNELRDANGFRVIRLSVA